ncbi:MAG TPA: MBL fold metallo-hydrolase [Glaciibacter sp.]|nr:MBL fold metallo-hydrolase [Glaciibacter sp.]
MADSLTYDVLVSGQLEQAGQGSLPDGSPRTWSPISSTLISGQHDAVLVDPPLTLDQAAAVGDWIERSGKRLTSIYLTHGHGDHWFGALPLLERFPSARALATEGTQALMSAQGEPAFRRSFWETRFPGMLPAGELDTAVVGPEGVELEGHQLVVIEAGHTDTDATTMLHVPDLGLLVAGDVVYNGVHPYLAESADGGIDAWLAALDLADSLGAASVVAGHKDPSRADDPGEIDATRRYLLDARARLESSATAEEYFEAMVAAHPGRINEGAIWGTAITFLPRRA